MQQGTVCNVGGHALPALRRKFTPGTAVLVKASHAMEFGKIVSELEKCNESTI